MIRPLSSLAALGLLAACAPDTPSDAPEEMRTAPAYEQAEFDTVVLGAEEPTPLMRAISSDLRSRENKARDPFRNPLETLTFCGVESDDTVIEIWPFGGWYSEILAPYLNTGGGTLVAANFPMEGAPERFQEVVRQYNDRFTGDGERFGRVELTEFGPQTGPMVESGTADHVLTFRNVHNWMPNDYEAKFFRDAFDALRPGGSLCVVEHRLPSTAEQDPAAASGYVHEDYVKSLAADAGFAFAASSEVNANPRDTANHPFGVWTLPPRLRDADGAGRTPADYNRAKYEAIGESDRMTLRFMKPAV